jgi:hypothetical protein
MQYEYESHTSVSVEKQCQENALIFEELFSLIPFSKQSHLIIKVILLADSIRSWHLSWFGSPIIKKIPEY